MTLLKRKRIVPDKQEWLKGFSYISWASGAAEGWFLLNNGVLINLECLVEAAWLQVLPDILSVELPVKVMLGLWSAVCLPR